VALGQDEVIKMVLGSGDLPGYNLQSTGAETFKDQLPPPGMPRFALAKRLIRANWVASEHSDVMSADGRVQLFSDANLFKNAAAAKRIWKLERIPAPKELMRTLKTPAGAPSGARLAYVRLGGHAAFEMGWTQGRVVGIVLLEAKPSDAFTRLAVRRISTFLATAAKAEGKRIADTTGAVSV
jgi:hypothetical protein